MGSGAHLPATFGLEGRVAVVIGGTGGLASTMASALASAGARTLVIGRDEERGARMAENLRADGDDVVVAHCDVSSRAELRALVQRVLDSHGRIDVLVNGDGTRRRPGSRDRGPHPTGRLRRPRRSRRRHASAGERRGQVHHGAEIVVDGGFAATAI